MSNFIFGIIFSREGKPMTNTIEINPVDKLLDDLRNRSNELIDKFGTDLPSGTRFYAKPLFDKNNSILIAKRNGDQIKLNIGEELFSYVGVELLIRGEEYPKYIGGGFEVFFYSLLGRQPTLQALDIYLDILKIALEKEKEK